MKTIALSSRSGRTLAALLAAASLAVSVWAAPPPADVVPAQDGAITIQPINHATLALGWKEHSIYIDPLPMVRSLTNLPAPTLIVLTDIHADHLSVPTLTALMKDNTHLVAPPAVAEQLPEALRRRATILTNGQSATVGGLAVEAVAAYNLAPERQKFHPKGRGNGYVIGLGGKRIYLSGDTEDVPELRALQNIDVAFLAMNQPYTMTPEQAADAVKALRPKIVYPYHCRGTDLNRFKQLLAEEKDVEVRLRDWYATIGK